MDSQSVIITSQVISMAGDKWYQSSVRW